MNQRMNPDEAIDRVLAALSDVDAPREMDQRVLKAVQRRAPKQRVSMFALPSTFTHSRPWAIAAAGLILLSFAASLAVRKRHEPEYEDAVLKQHTPFQTAAAPPIAEVQPVRGRRQIVVPASQHSKETANLEIISDLDALAISEMNAPSKPAPPLPLTHQEKLLAGALHQAAPVELSNLRPEVRARQMELSKAEFRDFFEPPPAKDNE